MIYELRIYHCVPGKLPNLLRRFADHTLGIFAKHRIRHSEFYSGVSDANQLTYFWIWDDMSERERKVSAFTSDPAWIAARDASERDGPIVASISSQFFEHADFSKADQTPT